MIIAIIWSIAGGCVLIITAIGSMAKWNMHDGDDVRYLEVKRQMQLDAFKAREDERAHDRKLLSS